MLPGLLSADTLPEKRFWVTDGTVNAIVNDSTAIYIGGDFDYVGPNTGLTSTLNVSSGRTPAAFPYIDHYLADGVSKGQIYTAISDGQGGWFVGGDFEIVDDESRAYLLHINERNAIDKTFSFQPNAPVRALALSSDGSTLYVGGEFTNISANPRYRLAAITLADEEAETTHQLSPWNPSIDGASAQVNTLALKHDDSILYVGGDFSSVNGELGNEGITAINTLSGVKLFNWTPTTGGIVNALSLSRNDPDAEDGPLIPVLYAGGIFSELGGATRNNIAALNPDDGTATSWNPGASDEVLTLYANQDNTQVYLGGRFLITGGGIQPYIARIKTDTDTNNLDINWAPLLNGAVRTLYFDDFRAGRETTEEAIADASHDLYLGGEFTAASTNSTSEVLPRFHLARFRFQVNSITQEVELVLNTWQNNPSANHNVNVLALSTNSTTIFTGGEFSSIGGARQANFARLIASNGSLDYTWLPTINGPVNAISLSDDSLYLYIAGDFTQVEQQQRNRLARLLTFNEQLDIWAPDIENGRIHSMDLAQLGKMINSVSISPHDSNHLYAATAQGLYLSTDEGANWDVVTELAEDHIQKVVFDPRNTNVVYASILKEDEEAIGKEGIYRSTDSGTNWTSINEGLANNIIRDFIVTPDNSRIYLSTAEISDDDEETEDGGLYVSEDQGESWLLVVGTEIYSISIDPEEAENSSIYLGNFEGFFILNRAIPEGETEHTYTAVDCNENTSILDPCNVGLGTDVDIEYIHVSRERSGDDEAVIYIISNGKPFKSDDGGRSWRPINISGLSRNYIATAIVSDPNVPSTLYLSLETDNVALLKSFDSGISWEVENNGITNPIITDISIAPNDSNTLYLSASRGIIQKTVTSANAWFEAHSGIPSDIIYIGGDFFGSHPEYLAAVDTAISSDYFSTWNAASNNIVNALKLSEDYSTLYVGGQFSSIGGSNRTLLAALNRINGVATPWAPSLGGGTEVNTFDISLDETILYTGGNFTSPLANIAAFNLSTGDHINDWLPNINGPVETLKLFNNDNTLALSGDFTDIDSSARQYLASLSTTPNLSQYVTDWNPAPNIDLSDPKKLALNVSGSLVFAGGDFDRISDLSYQSLVAYRFPAPDANASPLGGSYKEAFSVTLTCSHEDDKTCDTIRFTTDEDLDTAAWSEYLTPIYINSQTQLSFYAVDVDGVQSDIETIEYIFDNTRPEVDIILPSGKYTRTRISELECNDGEAEDDEEEDPPGVSGCSVMFYTLDGSEPTFTTRRITSGRTTRNNYTATGTTLNYDPLNPVPIRTKSTLRVIAVDAAGNISQEIIGEYDVERGKGSGGAINGLLIFLLLSISAHKMFRRIRRQ